MIELTGINLAERKKQLNIKINEDTKNKINFDEIKPQVEKSDVDKLYKIGIASKYKDIEYIIEILKSGDSLYISKALKCIWLYDREYSHIINPEYLHENIFSLMSLKMTKKFLTTISMYLRDDRAIDFYVYCKKNKHSNIAMKFLIFTPEEYKLNLLKDKKLICELRESIELLRYFLGNSFDLAEAYYNISIDHSQAKVFHQLRHFYFISDVKYLDMVRKSNYHWSYFNQVGLRISKDIMKKHKDEIYKKPMIYLNIINKSILMRYSTIDDAKFYVKTIISHEYPLSSQFWDYSFCNKYDYILKKIPTVERLQFIKNMFNEKYPREEFETGMDFYKSKLYELMTSEERQLWALEHVGRGLELLGSGKDFKWYRFISFDIAFEAIKKYILVTPNVDDRVEIIMVLAESAKTEEELKKLFNYYYKRHVNEKQYNKERFINAVLSEHNVFNFGENCWDAFNKILASLEVYNILDPHICNSDFKNISLVYHIIHGKEVPEALTIYIDTGIYFYGFKVQTDKLSEENLAIVYQYLLQFYLDKINEFDNKPYDDKVKDGIRKYIHFVLDLIFQYNKPKEDIPEIVNKYINLDLDEFCNHLLIIVPELELTEQRLKGYLKKDKYLVVSKFPDIKKEIKNNNLTFHTFLKVLRTYFSNDLATIFLKLFKDMLNEPDLKLYEINTVVYGIFELADYHFIKDFISKYVPTEAKIDHSNIDRKVLYIQEAICRMSCYSRPPIPLSGIANYIKGDYVHYCLPMFYSYLVNLPKPLCLDFIKFLLNAPLSVQKHGLRMAFQSFNLEDLRKTILDVWENTKNVSLRSIIYVSVHNKISKIDENEQSQLFEDLKSITSTLHEDDADEVFKLLTDNRLPSRFKSEYAEIAWNIAENLPKKISFIELRKNIIDCLITNMYTIKKEVIESIIYDHVDFELKQERIKSRYDKYQEGWLVDSKWKLFYKYVTFYVDEDDMKKKYQLVMDVINVILIMWGKVDYGYYIIKQFMVKFLSELNNFSFIHNVKNLLFEQILEKLQNTLAPEEVYEIFWNIRISNICRSIISDGKQKLECGLNNNEVIEKSLTTFANEFSSLFFGSIESRQCFVSFFDLIKNLLETNISEILRRFNYNGYQSIKTSNTLVAVSFELLKNNKFETHMFALKLLPTSVEDVIDENEYKKLIKLINKLKSCEYSEVKYSLYKKIVTTDYIFREYYNIHM